MSLNESEQGYKKDNKNRSSFEQQSELEKSHLQVNQPFYQPDNRYPNYQQQINQQSGMAKQSQSLIDNLIQFIQDFDSYPFQDYYFFLVIRFLVYIYLFIKLSDILLGYQKPNLKTRVLRKFQFVYGEQILRQLDKHDMQELQITISNTILNATKELQIKNKTQHKHHDSSTRYQLDSSTRYQLDSQRDSKMYESERRHLKNDQICENSTSSVSKKSLRLKFDLDKNQYFDPPSGMSSLITVSDKEQTILNNVDDYEVQGESEEEKLSPTHKNKPSAKPINFGNQPTQNGQPIDLIHKRQESIQKQEETQAKPYPNIHYPEQELSSMSLQLEQKLVEREQNLLHLSDDDLTADLMEKEPFREKNKAHEGQLSEELEGEEGQRFPSFIKTQTTKMTDTHVEELDA